MKRTNAGHWPICRLLAIGLAPVAGLVGCAMLDPYGAMPEFAYTNKPPQAGPGMPPQVEPGMRLAGGADEALHDVDVARRDFLRKMSQVGVTRNVTAVTASALTGWALYNAFKAPADEASRPTAADKRRTLALGASLGVLYGIREYAVNPGQEATYNLGYGALTCLMRQSAALLKTERTNSGMSKGGDLDKLRFHVIKLQREINEHNQRVALTHSAIAVAAQARKLSADEKDNVAIIAAEREAVAALARARNTLRDGHALIAAVEASGRVIRERGHTIVSTINGILQSKRIDLGADDALKEAQAIATAFQGLGQATAADQKAMTSSGQSSVLQEVSAVTLPALSGLASGADSARWPGFEDARMSNVALKEAMSSPPTSKPPAATTVPTVEELEAIGAKLSAAISALKARASKAMQEAHDKKFLDEIERLREPLPTCVEQKWGDARLERATGGGCNVAALAVKTEGLYAARRPVAYAVLNFRDGARAARAIPECTVEAGLYVWPDETVLARPGDEIPFIIHQAEKGIPIAAVTASTVGTKKVELAFDAQQGGSAYLATVKLPSEQPPGIVTLRVTDSTGKHKQAIDIVVGKALKASVPASGASAAGSGKST